MRLVIILALLWINGVAKAANYYFSALTGDDSRSSTQAQNPATPWRSIDKLNSFFNNLNEGDSVLFKRGESFYGSIIISKSGTAGNDIVIGSYGAGARPVISGFTRIVSWAELETHIWESVVAVSSLPALKMVSISGLPYAMGRYPNISGGNNGWLNYESCSGTGQITDNDLPASPNWTGATAVIKKHNWVLDIGLITAHSNHTINYIPTAEASNGYENGIAGMSYFIENDPRTLDEPGEWYYNPSTGKLRIYSTLYPMDVQVATVEHIVNGGSKNHITICDLSFTGSNSNCIDIGNSTTGWTIRNCNIMFAGRDGISAHISSDINIENDSLCYINNNGIMLNYNNNGATIKNNYLSRVGTFAGMTDQSENFSCEAIHCLGDNVSIEANRISGTGFNGIRFRGNNVMVNKNFIEHFCTVKMDGGAIYTWTAIGDTYANQVVEDNIIVNGSDSSNIATVLQLEEPSVNGIYLDNLSNNIIVRNNSISHVNGSGIYMNSPINCTISSNTIFDCRYASIGANNINGSAALNLHVNKNICVAKNLNTWPTGSNQRCFYYLSPNDDIVSNLVADSNYYARPVDDSIANPISRVVYNGSYTSPGEPGVQTRYSLAAWKAAFPGFDQHSNRSPKTVSSAYDMRFEYNETSASKTITLGANYIDVKSVSYPGTITLEPYTSAVLIKNDAVNIPPVSEAGPNLNIPLPVTNINITGSGIDYDGTIAAYKWTRVSGPASVILTDTTSATVSASWLVQGVYKFELKVTDNYGAIGRDTTTINVNSVLLPITLIDFSAAARSGKTWLQWTTSTEMNSDRFEVERSAAGRNFETIGTIPACGNTNAPVNYHLTDHFPESGTNFYRLKMLDKDGQYEYSKTVSVHFKNTENHSLYIISSRSFYDQLEITLNSSKAQAAVVALYDATGKLLRLSNIFLQKGSNNIHEHIALAGAVYYLMLITGSEKLCIPLVNQH